MKSNHFAKINYKNYFIRDFNSSTSRFGFNSMACPPFWREKIEETETMDFGARLLDGDLGVWLALDPLMAKYPDLSPYCFVANSPIYWLDKEGKDLWIGGDRKRAEEDVKSIVPEEYRCFITVTNELEVKFVSILSPEFIASDAGLSLLNDMVNISDKKYLYEVSDIAIGVNRNTGKIVEINLAEVSLGMAVFSDQPFLEIGSSGHKPKDGYNGQVVIHPDRVAIEEGGAVKPRGDSVFHELAEIFERTDNKKPSKYQDPSNPSVEDPNRKDEGAHGTAIKRADNLHSGVKGTTPGRADEEKFIKTKKDEK